jgi:hypothetical protein
MTTNLARVDLFAPPLEAEPDVFGLPPLADAVPDSVLRGLADLAASAPLWGEHPEWIELLTNVQAFAARWHSSATAAGWSLPQLYGLDPVAPRARVGRMGAAFLVALRGHQVVEVDRHAITMVSRTAARLRLFRGEADPGVVLAWKLCCPA